MLHVKFGFGNNSNKIRYLTHPCCSDLMWRHDSQWRGRGEGKPRGRSGEEGGGGEEAVGEKVVVEQVREEKTHFTR